MKIVAELGDFARFDATLRADEGDPQVVATQLLDEPAGVGPQQFLPDDLAEADVDYYRPTGRGWEERLGARWAELRRIVRGR